MELQDFLDRLDHVRRAGNDYIARCPAHDDRMPSLSVTDGQDRILIFCHAGCTAKAIVGAMGLEMKALYYDDSEYAEMRIYDVIGYASKPPYQQPEAVYQYKNEKGELAYEVLRFPGKKFRQRRASENGWIWNMDGVKKIPYLLNRWHYASVHARQLGYAVYIVEGEKDVDRLRNMGYLATCFTGGAGRGKFLASYVKYFKDLNVLVIADNDTPGLAYAEEIRDGLTGVAASVTVVVPTKGKDITEHLDNGGTMGELKEVSG